LDFHAVIAKSGAMLRRLLVLPLMLLFVLVGTSVHGQLESGSRGILPIDTSGQLEIDGIHVDVGAKDSVTARYAAWRIAQREGFKKLYAEMHHVPVSQAPNLPDSALDQIVSSIDVDREQIGPNRYIADLGVMFDRARAAQYFGVSGGGEVRRSVPMLLIPVTITAGTATSVELKNSWQRAWAYFRTGDSPIDYVRISGLGVDPVLVNAAQLNRPGRGWWRNIIDAYGAADILVAEVQLERLYPGGPARARFIGRHGPDNEIIGGFTLTAKNSDQLQAMMSLGARKMDALFTAALAAGRLERDSTLNLPPPPVEILPEEEVAPVETGPAANAFQVQVSGKDVNAYNFAMAHLRTMGGVESASPQQINPGGTSYILVTFKGDIGSLASALAARGWVVESAGTVIKIKSSSDKPPPLPPPPQPATPAPTPAPQTNTTGADE